MVIVVLSPARTGTSKVTYLLQAILGIPMGVSRKELTFEKEGNECPVFRRLNFEVCHGSSHGRPFILKKIKKAIGQRASGHKVWGWKNPRTCRTIHVIHPFLKDPKYIVIRRDVRSSASSAVKLAQRKKKLKLTVSVILQTITRQNKSLNTFLKDNPDVSVLELSFNRLFSNKGQALGELHRLVSFLGYPTKKAIEMLKFVDCTRKNSSSLE